MISPRRQPVALRSTPRWTACVWLLLLAGMLRAGVLLWHSPLLGMANNYDMIRVQGCIDAYPLRDADTPPWANSWQAPLERYGFRDDVPAGCYFSSEALFAFAALPAMRWQAATSSDGGFSLRTVGWVKFLLLAALASAATLSLLRCGAGAAAGAHALVFALVVTDPAITLYLNSFYAEFAALFFSYAALLLVVCAPRARPPGALHLSALALAVLLACSSKLQHLALGLFLFGTGLLAARFGPDPARTRLLLAIGLGALLGLTAQLWHLDNPHTRSMRSANLTNAVLGMLLQQADDPWRVAERLGLPRRCGDHAGKTWYTPGLQQAPPCPELLDMSRARLLPLALTEPALLLRVYRGALARARPWITDHFGLVAGQVQGKLPAYLLTWSALLNRLPAFAFAAVLLLPALLLCGLWLRRAALGPRLGFVLLSCGLYPPLALPVVVFGDGYADVAKQFHLGTTAALACWVLLAGWLGLRWLRGAEVEAASCG